MKFFIYSIYSIQFSRYISCHISEFLLPLGWFTSIWVPQSIPFSVYFFFLRLPCSISFPVSMTIFFFCPDRPFFSSVSISCFMSIAYLCLYLALFSCVYHSLCMCFPSFSFFVFFLRSFSRFRVYFSRALSPSLFRSIALSHTLFLEDFFSFCLLFLFLYFKSTLPVCTVLVHK